MTQEKPSPVNPAIKIPPEIRGQMDAHDQNGNAPATSSHLPRPPSRSQPALGRPQPITRKAVHWGTLLVIGLGFALRLYALAGESLWFDELLELDIAQGPLAEILFQLPRHSAVPLDYVITHIWVGLGRQDYWVRLPAVIWGVLTLPLTYQLGRYLLAGRGSGLLLMTLLALSPFHVQYSQEVRPYSLLVLGVVLAGYAYWRLRETGRWRYLLILQVGVLIFSLAHLFGLVVFGPLLVFAGVNLIYDANRKRAVRSLVALLSTGLLALVVLLSLGWWNAMYHSTKNFGTALVQPEKFTAEASEKPNQGAGPQVNWSFARNEILAPLGAGGSETSLWLFNGLVGLGLAYLLIQKRYALGLWLALWVLLPIILIVAFLVYRGTFFASRYIISALPAYLMLLALGILTLPRWLKCAEPRWLSIGAFVLFSGLVWVDSAAAIQALYQQQTKEDWRLVSQFLRQNAGANDAIIVVNAESTLNWYYPPAAAKVDTFDDLAAIEAQVSQSNRSWVITSIFSTYLGDEYARVRAWLSEQGAIQLPLDPVITVYYLGPNATPDQLLEEIQSFALPTNHILYASLARENRRRPEVARQYFRLAIKLAPNDEIRAEYQAALESLIR